MTPAPTCWTAPARSASATACMPISATPSRAPQLVILCAPVGAYKRSRPPSAPHLEKGAILSDVGSVKGAVVRDVGPHVPADVHFIPAHPIAGTEFSGPDAGFASLFDGRWAILTPAPGSDAAAVEKLRAFWQGLGSQVDVMDVAPSRPGAGHHLAPAASDRLQHRGHGARSGKGHRRRSDQIFRRRLPRFHPHRRLRSHHVARRVPEQSRGGAGNAGPLQRGPRRSCSARCAMATARCCTISSPAPAPSAAPSSISARTAAAPNFGRNSNSVKRGQHARCHIGLPRPCPAALRRHGRARRSPHPARALCRPAAASVRPHW